MPEWDLPQINYESCTLCGACVEACTQNALQMTARGPVFSSPQNCTYCADCEAICPSNAIRCEYTITWGSE